MTDAELPSEVQECLREVMKIISKMPVEGNKEAIVEEFQTKLKEAGSDAEQQMMALAWLSGALASSASFHARQHSYWLSCFLPGLELPERYK